MTSSAMTESCSEGQMQQQQPPPPVARYSKLSEKLRQMTPDDLQCSMFCGGRRCKYDVAGAWEDRDTAITGIYSHWITNNILASARPNTQVIEKYDVINQFERANIKSLINLQSRNEHMNCGGPLHESGFSYNPQVFMNNGIFFYNFTIKDYGVASYEFILDMVKVMAFALTEGKVAVHCHAGLGRTGVLIACYLVYSLRVRANEAIRYVRYKRPNSIQTRGQILCVQEFARAILPNFIIFPTGSSREGITLEECLTNQGRMLHGYEARDLKYFPKLVVIICKRLLRLTGNLGPIHQSTQSGIQPTTDERTPFWRTYLSATTDDLVSHPEVAANRKSKTTTNTIQPSPQELVSTRLRRNHSSDTLAWSLSCSPPVQSSSAGDAGMLCRSTAHPLLVRKASTETISSHYRSWDEEAACAATEVSDLDDSISLCSVGAVSEPEHNACLQELASQTNNCALKDCENCIVEASTSAEDVVSIFLNWKMVSGNIDGVSKETHERIEKYKHDLNDHSTAWDQLARENNPHVLVTLLCTWLHGLKEPIFGQKEIDILTGSKNTKDLLNKLPTGSRFTAEYLVRFTCQLQPLSTNQRHSLLRRVTELLIQNNVTDGVPQSTFKLSLDFLENIVNNLNQGENNNESVIS